MPLVALVAASRASWTQSPAPAPSHPVQPGAEGLPQPNVILGGQLITCKQYPLLEKEMATHSSVLAWRIPGTGEPGGLPSMGSHRVGHDWSDLAASSIH